MGWYAVHTKPQKEWMADRDLGQQGVRVFYPKQRIRRHIRRNGALIPRWLIRPYYPRWIFVRCAEDDLWRVSRVKAVSGVGRMGNGPVAIPDPIMSIVMAGSDTEGIMASRDEVARQRFEAAQRVCIRDGALEGVVGTVLRDDGGDLVEVLISMLGGKRAVKVRADTLQLSS